MIEELKEKPNEEVKGPSSPLPPIVTSNPAIKKPAHNKPVIIYFIIGVIEILLLFRFIFKLSGADPMSGFVNFIYNVTNPLVSPYAGFVFEPGTLMAMIVYAFLAWGIAKIILIAAGHFHNGK